MLEYERIKLDFRAKRPLYIQLIEQLRQQIESGSLEADEQLPPVRTLAEKLQVNFNTVARAYRILDIEGWISTQQGRGTYISTQSWPRPPSFFETTPPPALVEPDTRQQADLLQPDQPERNQELPNQQRIERILTEADEQGVSAQALLAYLLKHYSVQELAAETISAASPEQVTSAPTQRMIQKRTTHRKWNYRPRSARRQMQSTPGAAPDESHEDKAGFKRLHSVRKSGQLVRKHKQAHVP